MMMERKIVAYMVMLLAWCFPGSMWAQNTNDPVWGLKVAVDAELPGKWHGDNVSWKMYSPGYGLTVGGVCDIDLGRNFFFEPGATLAYSQYKYKDLTILGDGNGVGVETNPKVCKWAVQMPLLFGYMFDFLGCEEMKIFTGPQLRYAFYGKIVADDENFDMFTDLWGGPNGQRRFDCSWKIGVGIPMENLSISLEADFGITNLLKGDMRFRENRIGLGLTYYFGY